MAYRGSLAPPPGYEYMPPPPPGYYGPAPPAPTLGYHVPGKNIVPGYHENVRRTFENVAYTGAGNTFVAQDGYYHPGAGLSWGFGKILIVAGIIVGAYHALSHEDKKKKARAAHRAVAVPKAAVKGGKIPFFRG